MTDKWAGWIWTPLVLCLMAIPADRASAQERTPEQILDEVKAVGEPDFDPARKQEPGYLDNYKRKQHELYRKKAEILLELCRQYPEDDRVPEWMNRRWTLLAWNQDPADVADEVLADVESILATNHDLQVARDGAYWKAHFLAHKHAGDARAMMEDVAGFVDRYPDDEHGAALLDLVASDRSADRRLRLTVFRRLAKDYPDTHYGTYAPGMVRRIESLGQPFTLKFKDFTTGEPVSTADLKGKVVLIDFWATTCTPCVAEMPKLKKLYERYHAKGVEFIGVSLDESVERGGDSALRKFVATKGITWPQYYQGNGYDSEFSKGWGVGSAPTMFLLDKQGRLRHTDAVGRLEELIPALFED